MYNLSLLGRAVGARLVAVDRALSILLSLLTLRVEDFGDEALKQVKLIDANPSASKNSTSSTSKKTLGSAKGGSSVQFQILNVSGAVQVTSAKQTGAGASVKASNASPLTTNSATKKSQSLKIGNMVIPTFNLGKEQGGTTLSPLLHSTVNSTNPVIKAVLAPSLGPLTLEQLQSLLVKSIPVVIPQTSAQKSTGASSKNAVTTTARSTAKQPNSSVSSKSSSTKTSAAVAVCNNVRPETFATSW